LGFYDAANYIRLHFYFASEFVSSIIFFLNMGLTMLDMKQHMRVMKDYLIRAISEEYNVRAIACITTGLVSKACTRHKTFPTASAALGRALTGGLILGALLDPGQRVALAFDGKGPLGKVLVEAVNTGTVKGYVKNPQTELDLINGKLDVAGAVGKDGFLTVTKDLGLKDPYRGIVRLVSGEIASDIAYYLTESEQIPSAVGLGVYVDKDSSISAAGGFLVQTLPPSNDTVIDKLVDRIQSMPTVTEQFRHGISPEGILEAIFGSITFKILGKRPIFYRCSCSPERIEQALITLGRRGLESVLHDEEDIDIKCEFCRRVYIFKRAEINRLLDEMH
jgi:molecular chaperone Hsp33